MRSSDSPTEVQASTDESIQHQKYDEEPSANHGNNLDLQNCETISMGSSELFDENLRQLTDQEERRKSITS